MCDFCEISDKFSELETENKVLKQIIKYLEERHKYLRTRCMENARDPFDKGLYGELKIIRGK